MYATEHDTYILNNNHKLKVLQLGRGIPSRPAQGCICNHICVCICILCVCMCIAVYTASYIDSYNELLVNRPARSMHICKNHIHIQKIGTSLFLMQIAMS